ncbi:MAG TPA: TolC family protein [Bacteroidota bacterium]|nr:TolC family protein [Bacteroidota bacterium]
MDQTIKDLIKQIMASDRITRLVFRVSAVMIVAAVGPLTASSEVPTFADTIGGNASLQSCVRYALVHQPSVNKSLLDEEIVDRAISSRIADWYPQLSFNAYIQHDPQIPVSVAGGTPIPTTLANSSGGLLTLTQTLFNRDVLLASSTASDVRRSMEQQTVENKIDVVASVSKAFYAVLVTQQQLAVLDDDILRLQRSLQDAFDEYKGGVVDKTDYKRATISLNNARAERRETEELLKARYTDLRNQMGYPPDAKLKLSADVSQMEREAFLDTTQNVRYEKRVEYRLLETQKRLQEANLSYAEWGFLPSLSFIGNYTVSYMNAGYPDLYRSRYASSFVGLQLSLPILEGGKRWQEIKEARLELDRYDYEFMALKNSVNAEFVNAMANYKSDLNNYRVLKENVALAEEVFETIQLQYKAGTKTYLELITAETDLRSAQINHTNALYEVLSSKLDVQKALGTLPYE